MDRQVILATRHTYVICWGWLHMRIAEWWLQFVPLVMALPNDIIVLFLSRVLKPWVGVLLLEVQPAPTLIMITVMRGWCAAGLYPTPTNLPSTQSRPYACAVHGLQTPQQPTSTQASNPSARSLDSIRRSREKHV